MRVSFNSSLGSERVVELWDDGNMAWETEEEEDEVA
jgi:hypothetical protein